MLSIDFVKQHHAELAMAFPKDWASPSIDHLLAFGFRLKLLGIEWSTNEQLIEAVEDLHHYKLLLNEGEMVKVNPDFKLGDNDYGYAS